MVTITNSGKTPQGIYTASGLVFVRPGASVAVEFSEGQQDRAEKFDALEFGETVEGAIEHRPDDAHPGTEALPDDADDREVWEAYAERNGITLPTEGSGKGGNVLKSDVIEAVKAQSDE